MVAETVNIEGQRAGKSIRKPAHGSGDGGRVVNPPANKPAKGWADTGNASPRRAGRQSTFLRLASIDVVKNLQGYGDVISVVDAADVFGVATQTVRHWIKSSYLPAAFYPDDYTDGKLYMRVPDVIREVKAALASQVPI